MTDTPPESPRKGLARRTSSWLKGFSLLFDTLDGRLLASLIIAITAVGGQPTLNTPISVMGWLAEHGLSPRGYTILMLVCAGLILHTPTTPYYQVLIFLAFFPWLFGTFGFIIMTGSSNWAPAVLYSGLFIYMLVARTTREQDDDA